MTTLTTISPEARRVFAERIEQMDHRADWGRLPSLDTAMHPARAVFSDDLSDSRMCNDRFIESRVVAGNMSSALCIIGGMHNLMLASFIAVFIDEGEISLFLLGAYLLFGVGFCLNLIRFMIQKMTSGFVRFNRQAQLVHIWPGVDGLEPRSIPWRDAVPFTNFVGMSIAGGNLLYFLFPTPEEVWDSGLPIRASGALRFGDGSLAGNLERLEFLRRYMAHGLDAVRPECERTSMALSGYEPAPMESEGPLGWLFFLGNRAIYYFGGGPLIDRWIRHVTNRFEWPDEVNRLCAEGADLSNIDVTPLATRPDVFYRYGGIGNPIVYVDAQDRVIP